MRSITRPSLLLLGLSAVALPALAQQPGPATKPVRLLYDLPADEVSRAMTQRAGASLDDIVTDVITCIRKRLGDKTTVERRGATVFAVEAPDAREVAPLRRRIELAGMLEMRVLATDDCKDAKGNRLFDLAKEKQRLVDWLDHGGRQLLANDPRAIDRFLGDPAAGPLAGSDLCWFVHAIEPRQAGAWNYSFAQNSAVCAVMASDPADWNEGQIPAHVLARPREQQRLLELVAVNMQEPHFDNRDLDPGRVSSGAGGGGNPCVRYQLRDEVCAAYGDWSQKHIGHHVAMLLEGRVLSAPRFMSRIPGIGMIEGDFSKAEAEALAKALEVDPLPVKPVFLKQESSKR
jgi:preprotein translocase subunit SecD